MRTFLNSPNLAAVRFFNSAARHLSFKLAARELNVTQSAVSQQIKHLEKALGCPLFQRLPRSLALTRDGERFAAVVARSLADIEAAAHELEQARTQATIRLRAGPSFALRWLVPRIGSFYRQHPDINLFIVAEYGKLDAARQDFDLAVEMMDRSIAAPPGFYCEELMEEYLIPVCSPSYLAQNPLRRPEDLERSTLLHDADAFIGGEPDQEWSHWLTEVGVRNVSASRGRFFTLANMSLEAALADQGVALGRGALIEDLLRAGRLVTPFKAVKSPQRYCLLHRERQAQRRGLREVMTWLRDQVAHPAAARSL